MRLLLHADSSRNWESAATVAARLARATGGHATVLTAERIKRRQQDVLRRAENILGLDKEHLALRAQPGLVEQVVPEVANEGFDLLVLAPLGGRDWLVHGHIVSRIVSRTACSVLMARGKGPGFEKALVATEGGPQGVQDVDATLRLARVFDMQVNVLHVVSQIALYDYIKEQAETEFLGSDEPAALHLRELRQRVLQAGLKGEARVRVGPVVEEVVAELKEGSYDLLVIGAHAEDAPSLLTRDISAGLLRHCPVSTLVVRDSLRPGRRP
ncbi:MAG: universal stress protein [Halobacteriales archaeon]|nr:universal stress protein [Halobacteriales archaeon]